MTERKNNWIWKGFWIGVGSCVAFAILVAGAGIIAYLNGFFDNSWKVWLEIDRNVDTSNNRVIDINETPETPANNDTPRTVEEVSMEENQAQEQNEEIIASVPETDTYIKEQSMAIFEAIDADKKETIAINEWKREKESELMELEIENERIKIAEAMAKAEAEKNAQIAAKLKAEAEAKQQALEKKQKELAQKMASSMDNQLASLAKNRITINDIDMVNLYEMIGGTNTPDNLAKDFLTTYYLLYNRSFLLSDFQVKWKAFDLKNKPQLDFNKVKALRPKTISKAEEIDYIQRKNNITNEMKNAKLNAKKDGLIINPCFYTFCKENKEVYGYVKKAMIGDVELQQQLAVAKKDWVSPKFYLTILLIENNRMHTQYKGAFKSVFMKYSSPKLAVMSKFSYGKYWTKVNFITNLINANYKEGSIFSIGDYPVLKEIKDKFYLQNQTNKNWYPKSEWQVVEWLIANKQGQTDIISAFFKMAAQGWKTQGIDLWKWENAGILLTLYNLGRLGEPKKNPELWGATLNFSSNSYNFGEMANVMYNSLELDDIMQQMAL